MSAHHFVQPTVSAHQIQSHHPVQIPITSQEDIFMSNIRDLAMTFYNEFVENGGDVYEPDSRFSFFLCP